MAFLLSLSPLKSLSLPLLVPLNTQSLLALAERHGSSLDTLAITVGTFTQDAITRLTQKCTSLRHLYIDRNGFGTLPDNYSFLPWIAACHHLKGLHGMTSLALDSSGQNLLCIAKKSLQVLSLCHVDIDDWFLQVVGEVCVNLRKLSVENLGVDITDTGLVACAKGCTQLESLIIATRGASCPGVTVSGLSHILQLREKTLLELQIEGCQNVTADALKELRSSVLRYLQICPYRPDVGPQTFTPPQDW
eukprot:CAMPEP_0184672186 /NCGR_PEP_ID=MMETSP0308-20130426/85955_1 /TAXON_ID=38269 /ORGANISM="Gloeochaete witrockiana, Strain SAG 46.84" /LENGTH=247 /DNA_ID=CAMNT_0027119475 /DNA_START=866 /DNA_END=1606 /DNA_ORIENTATION=-